MLKGMALEAASGVLAVIPAQGIPKRAGMCPVAGQTEHFGLEKVMAVARWMLAPGDPVLQSGPVLKIGMPRTIDGNSQRMSRMGSARPAGISSAMETFVAGRAKIVHPGNIDILLVIRIGGAPHQGLIAVDPGFQIAKITVGVGVMAGQTA